MILLRKKLGIITMNSYETKDTCELINLLDESRSKLNTLKQKGAFKDDIDKAEAELRDIRNVLATKSEFEWRQCYQSMGEWTYRITPQFASMEILSDLYYYKKFNYLAIDNGILLYAN